MKSYSFEIYNVHCESCAEALSGNIKSINGVKTAVIDSINQKASIELEDDSTLLNVYEKVKKEISSYSKAIDVRLFYYEFYINGEVCSHCVEEIESKLKEKENIIDFKIDNINKKVSLVLGKKEDGNELAKKLTSILGSIEKGVSISLSKEETKKKSNKVFTIQNILNACGIVLFIVLLCLNLENKWLNLSLFIVSYLLIGYEVIFMFFKNIIKGRLFDENFLMTIATIGAFILGEYMEAVAVMIFYNVGERFNHFAVSKSVGEIKNLMNILPSHANLVMENEVKEVDVEELKVGDKIVIKAGEKVPCDAVVVSGMGLFDTSKINGEPLPINATEGENIISGYINIGEAVTAVVVKVFKDSTAKKITDLIEEASSKKSKQEKFITKFSKIYTPIVIALAVISWGILWAVNGGNGLDYLKTPLMFLIISCPCSLVLSIPLAYFAGIGNASRNGILIKGSSYIDVVRKMNGIIFDKTGTLTEGKFSIKEVECANGFKREDIIKYTAYAEYYSNHPLALSIIDAYGESIDNNEIQEISEMEGKGIKANVLGKLVLCGNEALMELYGVDFVKTDMLGSIIYVAVDGVFAGSIILDDKIKAGSKELVSYLNSKGINTIMLSGDNEKRAKAVADEIGIKKVFAECSPKDKMDKIEECIKENEKGTLGFVGDGINDVLAIKRADVGFSLGNVTESAMESADVVIPSGDVKKIGIIRKIANKVKKIATENIVLSLGVKLAVMAVSFFSFSSLLIAILADTFLALLTVMNSLRVMRKVK